MQLSMIRRIHRIGACEAGMRYILSQPDPETAWRNCERADWMIYAISEEMVFLPSGDVRAFANECIAKCEQYVINRFNAEEKNPPEMINRPCSDSYYNRSSNVYCCRVANYVIDLAEMIAPDDDTFTAEWYYAALKDMADIVRQICPMISTEGGTPPLSQRRMALC